MKIQAFSVRTNTDFILSTAMIYSRFLLCGNHFATLIFINFIKAFAELKYLHIEAAFVDIFNQRIYSIISIYIPVYIFQQWDWKRKSLARFYIDYVEVNSSEWDIWVLFLNIILLINCRMLNAFQNSILLFRISDAQSNSNHAIEWRDFMGI